MATRWSKRQQRLRAVVVLSAVIFLGDIVALNVTGEVSSAWWLLAVPVGLLAVPIVGVVALIKLIHDRRHA